jgi:hypothetical protein
MSLKPVTAAAALLLLQLLPAQPAAAVPLDRGDFSGAAININFDGFPSHTQISTQYQSQGVVFTTIGSSPETNSDFAGSYGPLASGSILATGQSLGTNRIEMSFVHPVSGLPTPTTGVGADIIFRDTGTTATLEVFDSNLSSLGSATTLPDGGPTDEVFLGFGTANIYKAVFTFGASDTLAGIDNLVFEPVPEPSAALLAILAACGMAGVRRRMY